MEKQSVGFQPFSQSGAGEDTELRAEVTLLVLNNSYVSDVLSFVYLMMITFR